MTTARRTTTKNLIYILVNILIVERVTSCFLFPKRISANCDSDVNEHDFFFQSIGEFSEKIVFAVDIT